MKLYTNVNFNFAIWAVAILTIFFFGFSSFPHSGKFESSFLENLTNWDGGHFVGIAKFGYTEDFQYAFFPLYPIVIRGVNQFIQNYTLSSVLISAFSAFLAVNILYRLVSMDFNKKIAEGSVFWLLLFPTSFYFLTAYSEGLFFLFVVSTFLFLRKGNLFLATVFAIFASATRMAGLAVVLALLIEVLQTQRISRKNWYVLLSPLGFLIYCFYLFGQTGDPFYFLTAELHWQRDVTVPTVSFWETLKSLSQPSFISENFNSFLDLIFAIFGVGLGIRAFRFLPVSYSVYSMVSVLLPLFTPTLSSMPRFLLPVFPIFILLALTGKKSLIFGYQLISIMLLSAFAILFISGYWVS